MSQLYSNLVDATKQVVNQFGVGIIQEERFSNILSDICPDRDNPALFKIIKSASQEGMMQNLLSAKAKTIEHVISNCTSVLSKKYGYDSTLTEGILYSISVGAGIITSSVYSKIATHPNLPTKSNPPKKQASPPTKKKLNNPSKKKLDLVSLKYFLGLILGLIGLLIFPIAYLSFMHNRWWPLSSTLIIAVIQAITLFPMIVILVVSTHTHKHPLIAGASNAVLILAIIFWIAFPFICGIDSFLAYFGIFNPKSSPGLVTIIGNLFWAMFLATIIPVINEPISGINTSHCKTFREKINSYLTSVPYMKGFIMICIIAVLEAFALWMIPYLGKLEKEKELAKFNQELEVINQDIAHINYQKDSLKHERSKQERQLAFADFTLGSEYLNCLSIVDSKNDYKRLDSYFSSQIEVNGIDYSTIVDQKLFFQYNWNNELLVMKLYFAHQKLILLEFSPTKTNSDSIITIYKNKYGEPEYLINSIVPQSDYYTHTNLDNIKEDIKKLEIIKENIKDNSFVTDTCRWTYKNGMLEIIINRNYSSTIKYFDRTAESYLQEKMQHRSDSLKQVREKEEHLRQEKRELEELNHQKSINQI